MDSMEDVTPQIEAVNAELKNIQEEKAKLESESLDLRRDKDEAKGEFIRNVLVHFNSKKKKVQLCCINSKFWSYIGEYLCLLWRNH